MPCSPRMLNCVTTCRHRAFVTGYQDTRAADVERRDAAVGTYGPESAEFAEYQPPPITFKHWLQQMTGWSGQETGMRPTPTTYDNDVNPVCGCHLRAQCAGCGVCTTCDGCYCDE